MTESSLREFFSRNSSLFTVLGVFGAISVYFTQLNIASRWRRLGIVSSLTIFIIISITIQKNLPPESIDKTPFDFVIDLQRQRIGLVLFYVAFYAVVISVTAIVLQFSNTLIFLLQFLCFIGGIGIVRWLVNFVEVPEDEVTVGEDEEIVLNCALIIRNAMYSFIVGGGVLAILWLQGMIPIRQLVEFQIASPWTAILIGSFSGLMFGGSLWTFLMIMILIIHLMIRNMRQSGFVDEEGNINEDEFLPARENKD